MNNELSIKKETFSNETFGNFITTAKSNLNSLARKFNDTAKYNAYYIAFFDNNANIDGSLVEDWKRHNVNSLKDYVAKELNIGKSQYYNLLAIGKLLKLDEKGNPRYMDERLEHFNTTAIGLLINKKPENETMEEFINRLFDSKRINEKMSNNELRIALKDNVVGEDKKTTKKKADEKENKKGLTFDEEFLSIAMEFENLYNTGIVGRELDKEKIKDYEKLHEIFFKYVAKDSNPFEENK